MVRKISFLLLCSLPISLMLGNLIINLNIFLIDILVLYHCYKLKNWHWVRSDLFKLLIILYFYLIINSLVAYPSLVESTNSVISLAPHAFDGLIRSIFFIKFILLGYAFSLLAHDHKVLNKIMKVWLVIIVTIILDVFFEKIFGHNVLGYKSVNHHRIVSFFKDEAIVGSLILCFGFILGAYFLNKNLELKSKIFFHIFLLIVPLNILITGERSNFIKSFLILSLIIFLIDQNKLLIIKYKFVLLIIFIFFTTIFFRQDIYSKQSHFFKRIIDVKNPEKFTDRFQNILYFAHYNAAIKIFKDNPLLGVGNKNFRYKCHDKKYHDDKIKLTLLRCSTHPHQIHLQILSEHGLVGYLLIFYIFFNFLKKKLASAKLSKNIFYYSTAVYLSISFIPLLPSGDFFSTFNGTLFWIVFSLSNLNHDQKNY